MSHYNFSTMWHLVLLVFYILNECPEPKHYTSAGLTGYVIFLYFVSFFFLLLFFMHHSTRLLKARVPQQDQSLGKNLGIKSTTKGCFSGVQQVLKNGRCVKCCVVFDSDTSPTLILLEPSESTIPSNQELSLGVTIAALEVSLYFGSSGGNTGTWT